MEVPARPEDADTRAFVSRKRNMGLPKWSQFKFPRFALELWAQLSLRWSANTPIRKPLCLNVEVITMSKTFAARLNRLFDTVYPPGRGPHTSAEVIAALKAEGITMSEIGRASCRERVL